MKHCIMCDCILEDNHEADICEVCLDDMTEGE